MGFRTEDTDDDDAGADSVVGSFLVCHQWISF